MYFSLLFGFKFGIFNSIIIWCLFVVATPIPEAGLLVSVPLKRILGINLDITQWFVSIVALCFYSIPIITSKLVYLKPNMVIFYCESYILVSLEFLYPLF